MAICTYLYLVRKSDERLNDIIKWWGNYSDIFPFFWIDPLESDAKNQVDRAIDSGIMGFKVICSHFFPSNPKAIEVFSYIAQKDKPILFHSGILWDGKSSSQYNRPIEFEALIEIPNLRFALAHISWPWCEEHLAVYGKFLNSSALRENVSAEMFIDITPGTPEIYRKKTITDIFKIGYDVKHNVIFGSDSYSRNYQSNWAQKWIEIDNGTYKELGLGSDFYENIYGNNLKRFLGISKIKLNRSLPLQGI